MGTILLIVAGLLFTIRFGISRLLFSPMSVESETVIMSSISILSALICSTIAYTYAIPNLHWFFALIINIAFSLLFSDKLTYVYLSMFASGKSLTNDGLIAFRFAWIAFILGLILH